MNKQIESTAKSQEEIDTKGRYPWTHAADFLRMLTEPTERGITLSRSDAAAIHHRIAQVIGMDERVMAEKLANQYKRDNNL